MPALSRVLIIGGGPAGLSAAIGLRQAGVEHVEVAERTDGAAVIGSELSVSGPMLRALDQIGMAERFVEAGVAVTQVRLLTATGGEIASIPIQPAHRPELPPTIGMTRPNLHRVLEQGARAAGAEVRMSVRPSAIRQDGDTAEVTFHDGGRERYELVIGADGYQSDTRRMVFPEAAEPAYLGQMAWRARVPRLDSPRLDLYHGHGRKAGYITVTEDSAYIFVLEVASEPQRVAREQLPVRLREALGEFGGDVAAVRDSIVNPDEIHLSPLCPLILPPPWHRGRVLLIGDAAHATSPHLAYGAGLAVEDGVILGELARAHAEVGELLAEFTQRRYERCRMAVENAAQLSQLEQLSDIPGPEYMGLMGQSLAALAAPI